MTDVLLPFLLVLLALTAYTALLHRVFYWQGFNHGFWHGRDANKRRERVSS